MKAPLKWLAEYVDLPDSIDDLEHRLTMSGTEIENVIRMGEGWDDIITGRVTSLDRPEGSTRLQVAVLNTGEKSLTMVTAAPNIAVGQIVPIVPLGGSVPVGPDGVRMILKPKPMMGITGEGMVLSARELGISDEHDGILVLPEGTPLGVGLSSVLGGTVLDIGVTANRPDEISMLGVAREIAAVTKQTLREPEVGWPASVVSVDEQSAAVDVEDPDLCPRYTALRIDGILVGPSPRWLVERLESAGMRSINNVVDVTNFVMLELGQPLHAFDFSGAASSHIIVRRAVEGETLTTLDDVRRSLTSEMLVIADEVSAVAIAGVMGGGNSEVSEDTTSILLESANFERVSIRRTSRHLGLRTEASARFERGVPPDLTEIAIQRCVNLFAGIMAVPLSVYRLTDVESVVEPVLKIQATVSDIERLLGISIDLESAAGELSKLGFEVTYDRETLEATPPYWRRDVEGPADIAEEIARMIGYDNIPETLPGHETPPVALPRELRFEASVAQRLMGLGLSETYTDTLTSEASLARMLLSSEPGAEWARIVPNSDGLAARKASAGLLRLANAPTQDRDALRLSLLPSLLDVAARNLKHTRECVAFFEIARTFFPSESELPYERRTLGIVLAADREPKAWNHAATPYTFFDLKSIIGEALSSFALHGDSWATVPQPLESAHPGLHPGRRAIVSVRGAAVGIMGEVHPVVAERFEIDAPVRAYVAEIDLDALLGLRESDHVFVPIPRYPAVHRDISLVFPKSVLASSIMSSVRESGGEFLRKIRFVDLYEGDATGPDSRSISLALEFQSDAETLTQDAVSEIQECIVAELTSQFSAWLRA